MNKLTKARSGVSDSVSVTRSSHGNGRFNIPANLSMVHMGPNGEIKGDYLLSNLVVSAGKAGVASRINGSGAAAAFTKIAIGIGTTAEDAADTALESEITTAGGERAAATCSLVTTDVTNDTARLVNTFSFTGSFAITETGVFNDASAGTMLARKVFSAINVASGDSVQFTWDFDVD